MAPGMEACTIQHDPGAAIEEWLRLKKNWFWVSMTAG